MRNSRFQPKNLLRLFVTGFAMGSADLIPGVSGGTIAFLSGIYEELITSIKIISGETIRLFVKGRFKEAVLSIPFSFLVPLALGLFGAVLTLASVLSYLLETYPIFVWSFFFGLVLASTWIVLRRIKIWDISDRLAFLLSVIVTFFIIGSIPIETPHTPLFVFLSGMIAICAMILPGISGSFILLLLGKYQQILEAVTSRDVVTLGIFMLGAIIGLTLFSRVLSWLFANHHDISIAILAGIMLGSIRKLWPFKEIVATRVNSHGEVVPFIEKNILPQTFDMTVVFALLLASLGVFLVVYLHNQQVIRDTKSTT